MKTVPDSSVLFSALISGKEFYIDIFRASEIYVPDFIFIELSKYQEEIIKRTKLKEQFKSFIKELFSGITAIPGLAITQESYERALQLCSDTDPKDTAYAALSIEPDIPLWSNDKKLTEGLMNKGCKKIITTEKIIEMTLH